MEIEIHPNIVSKLQDKHNVTIEEVYECFGNVSRGFVKDTREERESDKDTYFFIAETDKGRLLQVIFLWLEQTIIIKSAYEPSDSAIRAYRKATMK